LAVAPLPNSMMGKGPKPRDAVNGRFVSRLAQDEAFWAAIRSKYRLRRSASKVSA
jgi:hypothetical protein